MLNSAADVMPRAPFPARFAATHSDLKAHQTQRSCDRTIAATQRHELDKIEFLPRCNQRATPNPRRSARAALRPRNAWALTLCGWLCGLFLLLAPSIGLHAADVVIPALDSPVVDTTGTLSASTRQRLQQQALDLQ
ncbi:MAG: hypothetical protein ACTS5I_15855, partial [Rhodanobacter sp.]